MKIHRQEITLHLESSKGALGTVSVLLTSANEEFMPRHVEREQMARGMAVSYANSGNKLLSVSCHESALTDMTEPKL
jgi:cation transport regulator ChaC